MRLVLAIALLFIVPAVDAQVLQLDGGGGNLFTSGRFAEGVGVTTYFPNSTIYTGLAVSNGRIVLGGSATFLYHGNYVTAGDQSVSLNMSDTGVAVAVKGLSVTRHSDRWNMIMFAGATGAGIFLPFAHEVSPQHIGTGAMLRFKQANLELSGLGVIEGGQRTAIGAAGYHFHDRIQINGSAGLLNNQRYFQGTANLISRFTTFYVSHLQYFDPFSAIGNSIGGSFNRGRFTANTAVNQSQSRGITLRGESISAGVRVGFISTQSGWYKSGRQSFVANTITENVRRFNVTETITDSAGRSNLSVGGSYRGNHFSIGVSHSIQFLLNGQGYEQVTGVSLSFRVHDTSISVNTITNPTTGKALWSATSEQYVQAGGLQPLSNRSSRGKYVISGVCVLKDNTPQEGCAVQIGNDFLMSNTDGMFELHERKNKSLTVRTNVSEFGVPGDWTTVSEPQIAQPGVPIRIVVECSIK